MSDETPGQEKQYEPTQKKLDDARKKGEIAKSNDLATAASYGGFLIAGWTAGVWSLLELGRGMAAMLGRSFDLSEEVFASPSSPFVGRAVSGLGPALLPWAIVPGLVALLVLLAQRGLVFAPSKLEPKLSRISPIKGFKNKFGRSGLFEFAKSFGKLLIYSTVLGVVLVSQSEDILGTNLLSPGLATATLLRLGLTLMTIVFLVALAIGGIDFLWQRAEHMRKNRMSRKELTDEQKEAEGDPHLKQQRRQRAVDIAMNQMLADVPEADVVIVNPTHYAVALKWDRLSGRAPVCVAKGVDHVAARIRELADEARVPIHTDPPTARALHATIDIGQEITTDHYKAVAAAIRFAERMRRKVAWR